MRAYMCVHMCVPAWTRYLKNLRLYSMGSGVGMMGRGLELVEPEKKWLISELHLVIGEN